MSCEASTRSSPASTQSPVSTQASSPAAGKSRSPGHQRRGPNGICRMDWQYIKVRLDETRNARIISKTHFSHAAMAHNENIYLSTRSVCWFLVIKESCKNLPTHFKQSGSFVVMIKRNLYSALRLVNSSYFRETFPRNKSLSALLTIHSKTKCLSSSISSHTGHFLLATGVLGLVCRPLSISNKCELHRSFAIE